MNLKREKILNKFAQPKTFNRFVAAAVDAACFGLVAYGGSLLTGLIVSKTDTKLESSNVLLAEHISSNSLCKVDEQKGYLKYESNELFTLGEDNRITAETVLKDYYLSYLTGENLKEGNVASLNYDKVVQNGLLPKEFYTVEWLNENVLDAHEDSGYFVYVKNDGVVDKNVLAVLNEDYIIGEDIKSVKYDKKLEDFVLKAYDKAISHFYAQDFIKNANNYISMVTSFEVFGACLLSALIFYVIIPACNQYGITIGKKIMGLILINESGFRLDRWRLLLRVIPLLVGAAIISFIPNISLELICVVILFIVSLTLGMFTPHKTALHDLIGRTIVVSRDNAVVCIDINQYNILYKEEVESENSTEREGE